MSRRRESGAKALYNLVIDRPLARGHELARAGARAGLQQLLLEYDGNFTRAARDGLGLSSAQALAPLIDELDLRVWIAETWPDHRSVSREDAPC